MQVAHALMGVCIQDASVSSDRLCMTFGASRDLRLALFASAALNLANAVMQWGMSHR